MKVFIRLLTISMLMIFAAPAWSDAALHTILCEQDDDVTDEKVEAISAEWFKAAKTIKGGENLELYLNFPVAAKVGEVDVALIIITPSFAEWGAFMDNYPGSAAEAVDEKYSEDLDCGNGTLWESLKIE
jgi:hypothetical protein